MSPKTIGTKCLTLHGQVWDKFSWNAAISTSSIKVLMNMIGLLSLATSPTKKMSPSWYQSKFKKWQGYLPYQIVR